MNIEKDTIFLMSAICKQQQQAQKWEDKYDIPLLNVKNIKFLPSYITSSFKFFLEIINISLVFVATFVYFFFFYNYIYVFEFGMLFIFSYAIWSCFLFTLQKMNIFNIKERMFVQSLKFGKKKRRLYFKRKSVFVKELPHIENTLAELAINKKRFKEQIKKCDNDLLTKTYIELLITEQIDDRNFELLDFFKSELNTESISIIKRKITEKNENETLFEY